MNRYLKENKLFVAGHVSPIYGPVQALVNFLKSQKSDFYFVSLPFSYSNMPEAKCEIFAKGRLARTRLGHKSTHWEVRLWIQDFLFVLSQGWRAGKGGPCGLFIGIDNLNAMAGVFLRRLGRVRKVAYYVIDYTPQRFANPVLNWIYHAVDRFCVRNADVIWNLSVRMQEVRRAQGVPEERNQVVPVGVALKEVRLPKPGAQHRERIVYMGALQESKGIQLLIEAMPDILKKAKNAQLHIIGHGPYEAELKKLAAASPAAARIHIPGPMGHKDLFRKIPTYGVAVAPYLEEPGSYSYWCDPTKPKEYLACGLPIIITKVPWLWEVVADAKKPMGIAISYKKKELVDACVRLVKDGKFYRRCRENALEFASGLEWDNIYARAFKGQGNAAIGSKYPART